MTDAYERILCVKNEVFIYKIPPRQSSRGYRAADWKLDQPDWTARLRIVDINGKCIIKLEDKTTGNLFAQAPIDTYPGPSVEAVSDSSRYFVLRIQSEGGMHAFIGMGFSDRGDSFDFNVSLQDHFKREKVEDAISKEEKNPQPHVDLSFKEGQTIKINLGNKPGQESKPRPKPAGGTIGMLPPPPGGTTPKLVPPPAGGVPHARTAQITQQSPFSVQPQQQQQNQQQTTSDWGNFATFPTATTSNNQGGGNWVQF